MKQSKKTPGVGAYNTTGPKDAKWQKVLGNYTLKEPSGGSTEEAIYKGMSTPSHYPTVDFHRYMNKPLYTKITKPKEKPADGKLEKNNSPSPFSYRIEEKFDKT